MMLAEFMTWKEYEASIKERIIILPVGAIEQHGDHLPLSVDVVIAKGFSNLIAERLGGVVLPPLSYGYKSHPATGGGQGFPGTTSLNGATITHLIQDILSETHRHGGRKFLIVNGHLENLAFILEAVDLFLKEAEGARVMIASWWDLASEELRDEICREAGLERWEDDHAALTETSLVLYLAPELVRKDAMHDETARRRVAYSIFPTPQDLITESGLMYKVSMATPEIGERLVGQIVAAMAEAVQLELGD
jgi:creatinine amidohydrolase